MAELRDRMGGLPRPREARYIWKNIRHLEAHHSTALEGNTLVLREVEKLLNTGRAVGSKPLREYMEVTGYARAAEWVYEQAVDPQGWETDTLISPMEVRHIHSLVMKPVWGVDPHPDATDSEGPGSYREHEIAAFDQGMTPPTWPLVPSELSTWADLVEELKTPDSTPIAEQVAILHNRFEQIHPFIDGNGRTGRLTMNLILVRLGYPPVIIVKKNRERYLTAMQKADSGDPGPLGEMLARAMTDNLHEYILPNVADPAKLVPLTALADGSITVVALRGAAKRGRLDAEQRQDGTWLSSRAAVDEYKASRIHSGRRASSDS